MKPWEPTLGTQDQQERLRWAFGVTRRTWSLGMYQQETVWNTSVGKGAFGFCHRWFGVTEKSFGEENQDLRMAAWDPKDETEEWALQYNSELSFGEQTRNLFL